MYYYTILCRGVEGSNAAVRGSIPFHSLATLPFAAPFHSIRYTTVRGSILFHSITLATLPFAAPFHFIPVH